MSEEEIPNPPPVEVVLTLADIRREHDVLVAQEADLRQVITESILNVGALALNPRLLEWATQRYPNNFSLISVPVTVPEVCSDGVARTIQPYIEFCTGMSLSNIVAVVEQKIQGVLLVYSYTVNTFSILLVSP
jgi:hypothetical protein